MVHDAERFKAEDDEHRQKVTARNTVEAYAYQVKNSAEDTLKGKLDEADKATILAAAKEALDWLDCNQDASKDELERKREQLEETCRPIMAKAYQQQAGAGATKDTGDFASTNAGPPFPNSAEAGESNGPKVEEVD